jgi:hypothetical protein
VAPPDQKEHLHVKDDEKNDVGYGGKNEQKITTLNKLNFTSDPMMYSIWFMVCEKS